MTLPTVVQPSITFGALITSSVFNSAFGTLSGDTGHAINGAITVLNAADSAASAGTLMLRASDKTTAVSGIALGPNGTVPGIASLAASGTTANHVQMYDATGLVLALLPNRNLQITGQLVAGSGSNTLTTAAGLIDAGKLASVSGSSVPVTAGGTGVTAAGAAGNVLASNGTIWVSQSLAATLGTGTVPFAALSDAYVSPAVAADTVTIAAYGSYADSSGAVVAAGGSQTVSLTNVGSAGQPSGANSQLVLVSQAPGGSIAMTGGTVSGSPSTPILPTGNRALALVNRRGATANPTGVILTSDITNLRTFGGAGGGSGGAGGAPSTATYLITGANGSLSNALDVTNSGTALAIHPALMRRTTASASMDDVQQNWIDPAIAAKVQKTGATTIFINGTTNNPTYVKDKKVTNSPTASATAGAAGVQRAIFDAALSSGAGGLVTPLPKTDATTAGQTMLARYWWDGATLQDGANQSNSGGFVDLTPLGSMQSQQIALSTAQFVDSGVTSSAQPVNGGAGAITGGFFPGGTFYIPAQCHMEWALSFSLTYAAAGTTPSLSLQVFMDGAGLVPVWTVTNGGTYAATLSSVVPVTLAPGSHAVGLTYAAIAGTGSTVTFFGNTAKLYLKFWM